MTRSRRARPSERRAWIVTERLRTLEELATCAAKVRWSRQLFLLLLQELDVDETYTALVGDPERLPRRRYAEAIAVALLIRHSWRPDDLSSFAMQLGLTTTSRVIKPSPSATRSASISLPRR